MASPAMDIKERQLVPLSSVPLPTSAPRQLGTPRGNFNTPERVQSNRVLLARSASLTDVPPRHSRISWRKELRG